MSIFFRRYIHLACWKNHKRGRCFFGARFNAHWEVIHNYADSIEGIGAFRGSKYVQSSTGVCLKTEQLLRQGGEYCTAALRAKLLDCVIFFQREYDNLITIDVICHGVPSPDVWQKYLKEETACLFRRRKIFWPFGNNEIRIVGISFRDKIITGWKQYSFALTFSDKRGEDFCYRKTHEENIFMRGFVSDLYLRPACYNCPAKELKSGSDITIGDFFLGGVSI